MEEELTEVSRSPNGLSLWLPTTAYRPGDIIEGKVKVCLAKRLEVMHVRVRLTGTSRVQWTEYEHSDSGIMENRGDRDLQDYVNAQQLFPPQEMVVLDGADTAPLPPPFPHLPRPSPLSPLAPYNGEEACTPNEEKVPEDHEDPWCPLPTDPSLHAPSATIALGGCGSHVLEPHVSYEWPFLFHLPCPLEGSYLPPSLTWADGHNYVKYELHASAAALGCPHSYATHLELDLSSSPLPFYLPPLPPCTGPCPPPPLLDFLSPLTVAKTFPPHTSLTCHCLPLPFPSLWRRKKGGGAFLRRKRAGGVEMSLTLQCPHLNFSEEATQQGTPPRWESACGPPPVLQGSITLHNASHRSFGRLYLSLLVTVERCAGSNRTVDSYVIWRRDVASLLLNPPQQHTSDIIRGPQNTDMGREKAENGRREKEKEEGGQGPRPLVPPHSVLGPLHFQTQPFKVRRVVCPRFGPQSEGQGKAHHEQQQQGVLQVPTVTTEPLSVHYRLELSAAPHVNKWWHWWEHMARPLKVCVPLVVSPLLDPYSSHLTTQAHASTHPPPPCPVPSDSGVEECKSSFLPSPPPASSSPPSPSPFLPPLSKPSMDDCLTDPSLTSTSSDGASEIGVLSPRSLDGDGSIECEGLPLPLPRAEAKSCPRLLESDAKWEE